MEGESSKRVKSLRIKLIDLILSYDSKDCLVIR
jgi:hypothetical protein